MVHNDFRYDVPRALSGRRCLERNDAQGIVERSLKGSAERNPEQHGVEGMAWSRVGAKFRRARSGPEELHRSELIFTEFMPDFPF